MPPRVCKRVTAGTERNPSFASKPSKTDIVKVKNKTKHCLWISDLITSSARLKIESCVLLSLFILESTEIPRPKNDSSSPAAQMSESPLRRNLNLSPKAVGP